MAWGPLTSSGPGVQRVSLQETGGISSRADGTGTTPYSQYVCTHVCTAKSVETTSPQAAVDELDPLIDKRELKQTRVNGKRYQKIASLGSQDQDVYIFCERVPRGAAGDFHVWSSLTRLKSLTRSTPSSKRRGKREVKRLQGAEMANSKGSALR